MLEQTSSIPIKWGDNQNTLDDPSQECIRCQQKHEKMSKLERTGGNIVKMEQAKRGYQLARDDYDKANRLLLLELPQFYEKRVDYFQPSLQVEETFTFINDDQWSLICKALIRAQVDYYGESTRLFTHLASSQGPVGTDAEYDRC